MALITLTLYKLTKPQMSNNPQKNLKRYIQGILPGWKPLYWILQYKQNRRLIFHAETPTIYF